MTNPFKLPDDELTILVSLQNRWSELTRRYGELHYEMKVIDTNLVELDKERFDVVTQMQEKYGVGEVNLLTGEFIPEPISTPTTP